jgi:hypothetical protein
MLAGYPEPAQVRRVGPHSRTIENRIVACYRDREFYDGARENGYGGFKYDGRWVPIVENMVREYGLDGDSAVLQVNCEKGFLLHDLLQQVPDIKVRGTEISDYAIDNAMESVRPHIAKAPFTQLPFDDDEFDFVIALGAVYSQSLPDVLACLREIQRVGKGRSFVTLASYETEQDKRLFEWWTLLGTTILRRDEWGDVLQHVGYTGDYKLTSAKTLNLVAEELDT